MAARLDFYPLAVLASPRLVQRSLEAAALLDGWRVEVRSGSVWRVRRADDAIEAFELFALVTSDAPSCARVVSPAGDVVAAWEVAP